MPSEFEFGEESPRDYERGKQDARRDIDAGKLIYHLCGYPAPECQPWGELLWERCGVQLNLGGCGVSPELISYANGYNAVVERELESRFGRGILNSLLREAREQLRAGEQRASDE